ncbi:ABC transporter permease subunit [Paenibacillus aurantius]|uniref:ABC transporter permease subunit n=1 Tax=Paenibacillus aurantius TaxID=2918900 RepID=A0AA96LEJ6_9BACL|nr:ABC transporter permease subunit [Paenibacillus aurantius]WJH35397.1 ABC transporter permease subunit [Paenibacillus sp. CC-CFT747]WNQ10655.1 ABC transporter permease subunit [Paenibacillus aurantius]
MLSGYMFKKRLVRSWQLYVLMALPFLYLILFKYVPIYGAQIAFKNFTVTKGIWGSDWVGLKHFDRFVHSYDFWRILRNTLILSFYNLAAGFPFPILLALGLNYLKSVRFRRIVQMVTYAPHFISIVVIVGIVKELLDPRTGILNKLLGFLGIAPINFMGEISYFSSLYVWSDVWQHAGFNCIIFLAALASIDPSLHEAAVMDGASKLRRMWHIDLPGIMPMAIIVLILNTGHILDVGFEKVLLMQNPINLKASEIIDTYVYKVGLTSQVANYSYSTAIGLFKSIINLILLLTVNKIAQKTKQGSLW